MQWTRTTATGYLLGEKKKRICTLCAVRTSSWYTSLASSRSPVKDVRNDAGFSIFPGEFISLFPPILWSIWILNDLEHLFHDTNNVNLFLIQSPGTCIHGPCASFQRKSYIILKKTGSVKIEDYGPTGNPVVILHFQEPMSSCPCPVCNNWVACGLHWLFMLEYIVYIGRQHCFIDDQKIFSKELYFFAYGNIKMRNVQFTSWDFELFESEITFEDYEFFTKHEGAFKAMLEDQVLIRTSYTGIVLYKYLTLK